MAMLKLIAALVCVSTASAFFFNRDPPVATSDGREIEESCLALADEGSCEFYTCFERRLPCGREWYMLKTGGYYCSKMQRAKSNFSPEGQNFIDDVQQCLTQSLKEFYQREYIDCHVLEHQAIAAITPCFVENAFCDVLDTDARNFFDVYEFGDLFSRGAGKIWREVTGLVTRCGGEAIREFSSLTGSTIVDSFNNFFSSLSNSIGKKKK